MNSLLCSNCGEKFNGFTISNNICKGICPNCLHETEVEVDASNIIMAFAYDYDTQTNTPINDYFTDNLNSNTKLYSLYTFDTKEKFIEEWRKMKENPDGMWYWVLVNGKIICAGACDPDDESIFDEYFNSIA